MALESFLVEAALTRLISFITEEINLSSSLKQSLQNLTLKSKLILSLLCDAQKHHQTDSVTLWLRSMKTAVYDADDVMDAFAFEILRRRLEIQNRVRNKTRNFFSVFNNPIAFRFKIVHRLKDVNTALDQVVEMGIKLGLNQVLHQSTSASFSTSHVDEIRHTTHPFIDDSKILGRDIDKSKVVCMLLGHEERGEDLSVVAIVGLGGLGKTTLAQLIYNDESVTTYFSKKIWLCVSDDFSVKRLLQEMIGGGVSTSSIESLVLKLQDMLNGKRILLILDDVWNTNADLWECLKNSLLGIGASKESKILVTTRSDKVASAMQASSTHRLVGLSEQDSWSVFRQKAFAMGGAKEIPCLIEVGKKMVKRCGGVPLALKTLGALLHSKEEHEWSLIEQSNLWDISVEETGIMPALRLSFDHLPLSLKQCFAYCSIFPKDYKFEKDDLIHLWIAQGFIQPTPSENSLMMEDVGNDYFKSLLRNSIFQDVEMDKYGNILTCKMHDLLHDLAQHVSKSECLSLNPNNKWSKGEIEVRHLSLVESITGTEFPMIQNENAIKLRTLFLACNEGFISKFKCLRVLSLKGADISELPITIGKLKHLRYLDVSRTKIMKFPASITKLYNLQTLRLMVCKNFVEFPIELFNLINLRHLCFDNATVLFDIRRLTYLQTLPYFVVGKEKGERIEELGPLNNLRGQLELFNLECVRDKADAMRANLLRKTNVYKLAYAWGDNREGNNGDEDILEGLQPPGNLKSFSIQGFMGSKFSTWMINPSILPNSLVEISLINCHECAHLPTLGELPFLKFLEINGMNKVERIGKEFYTYGITNDGDAGRQSWFRSLEKLSLKNMSSLTGWLNTPANVDAFLQLEYLEIQMCYELFHVPKSFPSLRELIIDGIRSTAIVRQMSINVTTLASLSISYISELTSLPITLLQNNGKNVSSLYIGMCDQLWYIPPDGLQTLQCLQVLEFYNCVELESIPSVEGLTLLRTLVISSCDRITDLPIGLGSCSSLEKLMVHSCPGLMSVPVEDLKALTSLSVLSVTRCVNMSSLPLEEFLHHLIKLKRLKIGEFCIDLDSFPFIPNMPHYVQEHRLSQLEILELCGWQKLTTLPDEVRHLTCLLQLNISFFNELESLPEWVGELCSLKMLMISDCKILKYLPSMESMQRLTKLRTLAVFASPLLKDRCDKETGPEWFKISHLPLIRLY